MNYMKPLAAVACVSVAATIPAVGWLVSRELSRPPGYQTITQAQADAHEVYVTLTGHAYHCGNCEYLTHTSHRISLADASGNYRPCSRCRPPILAVTFAGE